MKPPGPKSSRPAPLPNRVTPFGEIRALPQRGLMMGNRGGRLHEGWEIRRRQASRRWIACVICFRDRRRKVMETGYTELFFLDEATALAAGHRPCFECRRAEARAFAEAWGAANGLGRPAMADEMDALLARERRHAGRPDMVDALPVIAAEALPVGAMAAARGAAWLRAPAGLRRWTPDGYASGAPVGPLRLLTPASTAAALRAGYAPQLHPTVR